MEDPRQVGVEINIRALNIAVQHQLGFLLGNAHIIQIPPVPDGQLADAVLVRVEHSPFIPHELLTEGHLARSLNFPPALYPLAGLCENSLATLRLTPDPARLEGL